MLLQERKELLTKELQETVTLHQRAVEAANQSAIRIARLQAQLELLAELEKSDG